MKIASSQLCLADKGFKESLEFSNACGYEGIELRIKDAGELGINATPSELREVAAMCKGVGITPCSLVAGVSQRGSLLSPVKEERELALHVTQRELEIGAALGINAVLVVPGRVTDKVPYDEAYCWGIDSCKKLAPVAEKLKVAVAIENVWNMFLLSPLEFRAFVDAVNSPCVGMFLDVANMVINGFPEQWLRIMGKRVKKVHFKDFRRKDSKWTPLREGDVNWPAVMKELRAIGYDDFVISEVGGSLADHKKTADVMLEILKL